MAYATRRSYAGAAPACTLTNAITSSDTTATITGDTTNWNNTANGSFFMVIDPGLSTEEKVLVGTRSGSSLSSITRGVDGTTAAAHNAGATCYPVFTATDADQANKVASTLTTKGDLLVTTGSILDSLAVGEASSALSQARSAQRVADADYKRATALQAEEIIPQKDYLRAKAEHEKASATLRAAEDHLRLLGVPSGQSAGVASVFPLTSPLAGTIIEKKAVVGGLAGPSDALFVVADLSTLWIEANLAEAQLAKVRVGAKATVTVGAYPDERFEGRVTYVASILDKETRSIPARIEVKNGEGRLKPEMFATATIESPSPQSAPKTDVLTVPDQAIVLMQGQPNVFVFENGAYEQRAIDPGDRLGTRTVVKSGVKAGEQVVSAGTYALKARVLKSQIGDAH
jgi:cobalt-zinc-cadmium efflux system membrane fusion protein